MLVQKLLCLFKYLRGKNLTATTSGSFPEKSCRPFLPQFLLRTINAALGNTESTYNVNWFTAASINWDIKNLN